jgi:hypothetical protein
MNAFSFTANKPLRGFAKWQTPEETLESFNGELYFLGYEEYEGMHAVAKVSENKIVISLDSERSFSYISAREKNMEQFFKNILKAILNDDYIKLYSADSEKIKINDIQYP